MRYVPVDEKVAAGMVTAKGVVSVEEICAHKSWVEE